MGKEHQDTIASKFIKGRVAFIPGLAIVFDSVNVGLLLSQLLYWHDKGKRADGFTYKTVTQLYEETGLTDTQQRNAVKKLRQYQVIDYKLSQTPAKRHFKVRLETLGFIISRYAETQELVSVEEVNKFVDKQNSITKSTQKNTKQEYLLDYPARLKGARGASTSGISSLADVLNSPFYKSLFEDKEK